nr:hypothetical protein [Paracoccus beibuensis]
MAALTPALEAEILADLAGEIGLHRAEGDLAADQLAGVELAAGIEGDLLARRVTEVTVPPI